MAKKEQDQTVEVNDGTEAPAPVTRKLSKTVTGSVLSFTVRGYAPVELDLDTLSEEIQQHLRNHGGLQKVGDSAAGCDEAEAYENIQHTIEQLRAGQWKTIRVGSGKAASSATRDLIEALVRATGKTSEACAEVIARLDEDDRKTLRKDVRIKKALAEIRLERLSTDSSTDADLSGLFA